MVADGPWRGTRRAQQALGPVRPEALHVVHVLRGGTRRVRLVARRGAVVARPAATRPNGRRRRHRLWRRVGSGAPTLGRRPGLLLEQRLPAVLELRRHEPSPKQGSAGRCATQQHVARRVPHLATPPERPQHRARRLHPLDVHRWHLAQRRAAGLCRFGCADSFRLAQHVDVRVDARFVGPPERPLQAGSDPARLCLEGGWVGLPVGS
eukprot:scaffold7282_cov113-Isochrysis_galbana.AAC.13